MNDALSGASPLYQIHKPSIFKPFQVLFHYTLIKVSYKGFFWRCCMGCCTAIAVESIKNQTNFISNDLSNAWATLFRNSSDELYSPLSSLEILDCLVPILSASCFCADFFQYAP
jgi:hypothetical protein